MDKVAQIKNLIQKECRHNPQNVGDWFFTEHLRVVNKFAQTLLELHPEANREVVELAVWLHDLQRINNLPGEHALAGAIKARQVLTEFKVDDEVIDQVYEAIRTHRADSPETQPTTLEGKILATADAMSHFSTNFYLKVFLAKMKKAEFATVDDFKEWAVKKIKRDFNDKMLLEEAKSVVATQYQTLINFFEMN